MAAEDLVMDSETAGDMQRSLPLQGASNFRDLGGYLGWDARPLRWRRLFRSEHLGRLSAADAAVLQGHGLQRVLDLRGTHEREAAPCTLPGVRVHSLAIEPSLFTRLMQRHQEGEPVVVSTALAAMHDTYRGFVRDNSSRYRMLFEHLLASDAPLVFHCTAGKDRTGMAAALVLSALGVSRDDVLADYLLTNQVLSTRYANAPGLPSEVLDVLNFVRADYLDAAFDAIEEDHGDVQAYLTDTLGLDAAKRERLASLYLAP